MVKNLKIKDFKVDHIPLSGLCYINFYGNKQYPERNVIKTSYVRNLLMFTISYCVAPDKL